MHTPDHCEEKNKNRTIAALSMYVIIFFILQGFYATIYRNAYYPHTVLQLALIRFCIWVVPVFLYLLVSKVNPFTYLKLNTNILKGLLWGVMIGGCFLAYHILRIIVFEHGHFLYAVHTETWFRDIFHIVRSNVSLYGIMLYFGEEVVFRGFVLQKIRDVSQFWIANGVSAVLFILIHIQGWIILHQFNMQQIGAICGLFIFSIVVGSVLRKTDSLWACVIIHFFADFAL